MSGGGAAGGEELLTVTVLRDEHGYGMKVSGDNPVYVQSVKEHGAAWRAGLRAGDRILRVDGVPVHRHTHQQVVLMIRANPSTILTVHQNVQRLKTPITAPLPVNSEKQRQLEFTKASTFRLMLENEQKYISDLRNELSKVPDVRKQALLETAEKRCAKLQREIEALAAAQLETQPSTPKSNRWKPEKTGSPPPNTGFLSGLPRSLSNLTGQSLRNLRARKQENVPPNQTTNLVRQNSEESNHKRRHNNTVPMVPTTCLDNVTPPPLPPRTRPMNPLAKPSSSYYGPKSPMNQSMPAPAREERLGLRRSSHSLDGELEGPQPNSIAMQMSYPLVNAPPPPLQNMENRPPILHVRSQSSPEHLDHGLPRPGPESWERGTPPPGTPPPPYAHNTQPCADPQRAIISMEEDDSPTSENSCHSGLFSNLRAVRDSKARTAVLLNWLLGERRCACACLLLILTDGYRAAAAPLPTLRRWAYEIQSSFLMPGAVLQLSGVDENMANEIEHVLSNDYEKEELLRNVFRKARARAKEELTQQLDEFQVKRQVGLGTLYAPPDHVLDKCTADKAQEQIIVERVMCSRLSALCADTPAERSGTDVLLAAVLAAALCLHCRPAPVSAAAGGARASFLQRDKLYKQRLKQLHKLHAQPFVVRGHHLQLQALTSVAHCHVCDLPLAGLAPQAAVCTDCKLRVHRACARNIEEPCCLDSTEPQHKRMSRFMERIHAQGQDSNEKKSRKTSSTANFLNMERSFRKVEDEPAWESSPTNHAQGEARREGSSEEPQPQEPDCDVNDSKDLPDKDNNWRAAPPSGRGVNRAESCRERDAPRRGKHRNASDPNRLTAHNHHDLEGGAATAPSGSSSSSSLSSRSNESNTVPQDQQASTSDWSDEEDPLAAAWADSVPPHVRDELLPAKLRKRQEVIHELILSEGSHVRWLKVLGVMFLRPLEAAPALLPPDELRALFPNLPAVRDRHSRLYNELRALRQGDKHVVSVGAVADAMLNTLGDSGYAGCLARFCRGQRMALEALRERRRKHKELHAFLNAREQHPRCTRLQLRDLLACVWQRLTKYQLLLESIQATAEAGQLDESEGQRLQAALKVAKDVLHQVDTAVRTAENQHRLRTIQSKLEVRASGSEWEELRRLDLTSRNLRTEGELAIRNDTNKKTQVLGLMLEDMLVLLQREGDKFVLKPITQPSQQAMLSPVIRWDTVLFRPNAAVRNTFFLMNINGVQMHELSTHTTAEYTTWVRYIQAAPLAKLTELKPLPHAPRSNDDSGINVSRNPSDASEKSSSTATAEEPDERAEPSTPEHARAEPSAPEHARAEPSVGEQARAEPSAPDEPETDVDNNDESTVNAEETHVASRGAVGEVTPPLEALGALHVSEPVSAHRATTVLQHDERLRRLDAVVSAALRAKSACVAELLGTSPRSLPLLADLAVAETQGQVDIAQELRVTRPEGPRRQDSIEDAPDDDAPHLHQLLLAAYAQATQLTEAISLALTVPESTVRTPAPRGTSGACGTCIRRREHRANSSDETITNSPPPPLSAASPSPRALDASLLTAAGLPPSLVADLPPLDRAHDLSDTSFDMLAELGPLGGAAENYDTSPEAAALAARLLPAAGGVTRALSRALAALAPAARDRATRARLVAATERAAATRHRRRAHDYQMMEDEAYLQKDGVDQTIKDQPSNGG